MTRSIYARKSTKAVAGAANALCRHARRAPRTRNEGAWICGAGGLGRTSLR